MPKADQSSSAEPLGRTAGRTGGSDLLLRQIAEGTASAVGEQFFPSLTRNLAATLDVTCSFVAEVIEPNHRVRTLAFWKGTTFAPNVEYDVAGTPCEGVLRGEICHYERNVQQLFPCDLDLAALSAESYLAVPLINASGRILGHLAVVDTKPLPLSQEDLSIFRIFGARAGAELDRKLLEEGIHREQLTLRRISEGTASVLGDEFFHSLVRNLAEALEVRHSFVSEFVEGSRSRVRTLAFWNGERFLPTMEYDLQHTPCEKVLEGETCLFPRNVQDLFPRHKKELEELQVESYLAIPIKGRRGEVLGHLAVMDTRPMRDDPRMLSIFQIYGARAGAELERLRIEAALKVNERALRDLFDEAPIAYVNEALDTRFIRANKTAMRILGITPEEVSRTYGRDFVPDTPEAQTRLKSAIEAMNSGADTSGAVLELRRKDNGQPIWIQWWTRPDPSGAFTRTMFIDITDRVLMEREKVRLEAQNSYLQEEIRREHNFGEIVGNSPPLLAVLREVDQVAFTDSTVLILGETGTGKELVARAIHDRSARRDHPLVKVNCGAISAGLVESELFGHVKGAFTGALTNRDGRFKLADRGTLFLDEVGELPLETQVKLLRVLQEQEFEPIGSTRALKVDVRIIAATNRDLTEAVAAGKFRSDLFYRLNVFPLRTPALRERPDDIPLLVMFFLQKFSRRFGKQLKGVSESSMRRLVEYAWPGNIRELQNVIERAVVLATGPVLEVATDFAPGSRLLPDNIHPVARPPIFKPEAAAPARNFVPNPVPSTSLKEVEKLHIESVLARTNWMIEGERGAAKALNLHPSTLRSRMQKLGIKRPARP